MKILGKEEYILNDKISLINPSKDIKKYYKLGIIKKRKILPTKSIFKLTMNDVKNQIANTNRLILEVSQDCNLRCGYCIHNGSYYNVRTHNPKRMSIETAKKSVDYFISLLFSKNRTKNFNDISISFFGGEPLLENKLIFEIIKYTNKRIKNLFKIKYRVTTNGVLLKPDIVDEFKKADVSIDISFDGPIDQHDKFRKFNNGKGSWKIINDNLEYIKKRYPIYYKSNVRFQITLHPYHDLKKIQDFFLENPEMFNVRNVIINSIRLDNLDINIINNLFKSNKNLMEIRDQKLNKTEWFYFNYKFASLQKHFDKKGTRFQKKRMTYTGACFPIEQLMFINSLGEIKICEKAGEFFLGDIFTGVNIKLLRDLMLKWKEQIYQAKCWECKIKYLCNICLERGLNYKNGEIKIDRKMCQEETIGFKKLLKEYFEFKESTSFYKENTFLDFMESI